MSESKTTERSELEAAVYMEAADKRIVVKKLPLEEETPEGKWWAEVDGEKVGLNNRPFWKSRYQAWRCGWHNLVSKLEVELANVR